MKNQTKHVKITISILAFIIFRLPAFTQELPRPTLGNSVIVSIEHGVTDSAEVDYIKSNLPFGLYAWPSFSHTTLPVSLSWTQALSDADNGIAAFKTQVNALIAAARAKKVRVHIVLTSGLARNLDVYKAAKLEDVRNAQWYNDNKIASDSQIAAADPLSDSVMGTLSRYARKVRANLYAKASAALAFLYQVMQANPETLVAVSGWGESELNFRRIVQTKALQDYFCDYSPFAVLEFRDWIQHAGLYDDTAGTYRGQGFGGGGTKYLGAAGLSKFNADFGTSFTSWDLRYFDWSLADDYDQVPQDGVNNDPRRIAYANYSHGQMMPSSGSSFIAGGFDPPRVMQPSNLFWELWRMFRETMVHNFNRDLALWASAAGIPATRWYSHQIAADYLFGTRPSDYATNGNNPRYYTSASPLWTANVLPQGSVGATIYDIKFPISVHPLEFVRTTAFVLPDVLAMSSNWAIMEYDAETYPEGMTVPQSSVAVILAEYLKIYAYQPHLINFWRWIDTTGEHQIKGMNKEEALRQFIAKVRDKARSTDLTKAYTPPKLAGVAASYISTAESRGLQVRWSERIWPDLEWTWSEWGDFHHFEVFRGSSKDFAADTAHLLGATTALSFIDATAVPEVGYYYRVRAVNDFGVTGTASDAVFISVSSTELPILSLSRQRLSYGYVSGGFPTSGQKVLIMNAGASGTVLQWTASADSPWIDLSQSGGIGNAVLTIGVLPSVLGAGSYAGRVTIQDLFALSSPKSIDVSLTVIPASSDQLPYGFVDLPVSGATGVSGCVPVSGWALDDVEVAKVEIRRNPDASDNPASIGQDGLVYIGDGVFVPGARPDVELANPGVPLNDRSGWGYMMLTNFLPNQGNGTYIIHAIAWDSDGHSREIGQTTFTANNASRTKPFGTLDTPAQGGTASGSGYVNFGWALTALPHAVPTDGSTINVWIDGIGLGHPVYNNYRADIAALFPGLANSLGAVGYFYLDTTRYENGVHSIAWSVADSNGDLDGVGSRYFTIENMGAAPAVTAASASAAAEEKAFVLSHKEISGIYLRKGFDDSAAPELLGPGNDGAFLVEVKPAERIVVIFDREAAGLAADASSRPRPALLARTRGGLPNEGPDTQYLGYQLVGGEFRPLPSGSSLDAANGIFYWQVGPGFLGPYDIVFVQRAGRAGLQKAVVHVVVAVK
jgi:hypothetical protein